MRVAAILLLFTQLCYGQGNSPNSASTTGPCSPASTGDKNTFIINCGIGKSQGDLLLVVVNKILRTQIDLATFVTKLDSIQSDVAEIRESLSEQAVPHIQPELVIDLADPQSPAIHISLLNISNSSIEEVRMSQNASVVRGAHAFTPVSATIPSRGRLSIPVSDAKSLLQTRQLQLTLLFVALKNKERTEMVASYSFSLPDGNQKPGVIDPRSFFESKGDWGSNAREVFTDEWRIRTSDFFANSPTGTLEFWAPEVQPNGRPNYISIENDRRIFRYDPVMGMAAFISAPDTTPLIITFNSSNRHMVAITWDEQGAGTVFVDGKSSSAQRNSH